MEIGERALVAMRRQILAQPIFLRLCLLGVSGVEVKFAVERDRVPTADVVAVIAASGRTGAVAEITEVRRAASTVEIVVARRRMNDAHDPRGSPRRREAALEILVNTLAAGWIRVVAKSEDRCRNAEDAVAHEHAVDEPAGSFVAVRSADCDVTRADHHSGAR